jgi:glycine cleavage system aminomethyltransferase T
MSVALRRSPASRSHGRLGATMETEAGWELPVSYGDEDAERSSLRDSVAICDVTARGKVDLRGELDPSMDPSGADVFARISPQWAMVLTPPGGEDTVMPKLEASAGPRVMVTDATHLFAGYALCGPGLAELIARTTAWDPETLEPGRATGASIADVRAVIVRRDLAMPVLEVYVATELARYAWETLLGVVSRLDGRPVGWRALRAEGWS